MDHNYSYDKVGNILSRSNPTGATSYSFDNRDRLTGVDAPGTASEESYSYDPAGNRLSAHNTSCAWQYNNNNQLLAYGDKALTYDATATPSAKATPEPTLPPS